MALSHRSHKRGNLSITIKDDEFETLLKEVIGDETALERIRKIRGKGEKISKDLQTIQQEVCELNLAVVGASQAEINVRECIRAISSNSQNLNLEKLRIELIGVLGTLEQTVRTQEQKLDPLFNSLKQCEVEIAELFKELQKENKLPVPKTAIGKVYKKLREICNEICELHDKNRKNCSDIYNATLGIFKSMSSIYLQGILLTKQIASLTNNCNYTPTSQIPTNTSTTAQLTNQFQQQQSSTSTARSIASKADSSLAKQQRHKKRDELSRSGKPLHGTTFRPEQILPSASDNNNNNNNNRKQTAAPMSKRL